MQYINFDHTKYVTHSKSNHNQSGSALLSNARVVLFSIRTGAIEVYNYCSKDNESGVETEKTDK